MATQPPGGDHDERFPFRATQSEQRIIKELLSVATLRGGDISQWQNADFLNSRGITTAAASIEALREDLFPEEAKLRRNRADSLKKLSGGPVRAHFDQTLESSTLTIHAQIHNKADYESLLKRLQAFDYDQWQDLCNNERIDAD